MIWLLLATACTNTGTGTAEAVDTTITLSYDTIPETREKIATQPVAVYDQPIKDELNQWKFRVEVMETGRTFHYTLNIQAKEARVSDSLSIPNFGRIPKIAIEKGPEAFSCLVGFLDTKQQFKPCKKISFIHDQLRITTVASYAVGVYKTKLK